VEELQNDVADRDFVRVVERLASVDRRSIEEGAVAAAKILEEKHASPIEDLRVLTTDGCVIEDDFTARVAAQDHALAAQFQHLAWTAPFDDVQESHDRAASQKSGGAEEAFFASS
jgi:hypothetical protein